MAVDLLTKISELFAFIEQGDGDALRSLYAENAVQIEHPNRLKPKGDRRELPKMIEDLARGKKILRSEGYEIVNAMVSDGHVAGQVEWTGVLDVPIGTLAAGDTMRAYSAVFLRYDGERIAERHNYDCFEDFLTPKS